MSRVLKRQYRPIRNEFKNELYQRCKANKTLAVLIVETYAAWYHRRHIFRIWGMLNNPRYEAFREDYTKNLKAKHITGNEGIWRALYFSDQHLHDKYKYRIPKTYAMGDALSVAYAVMKDKD